MGIISGSETPHTNDTDSPHLPLMRTYFALNLRANQKRTQIHHELQQNRYQDVVHGPPYERVEHWNRQLELAKLEYEAVEQKWRERDWEAEGEGKFFERVTEGVESLKELLIEIGDR